MRYRVRDKYINQFFEGCSDSMIKNMQKEGLTIDTIRAIHAGRGIEMPLAYWIEETFIPITERKPKTRKVMDYCDEGRHYIVIRKYEAINPFNLYRLNGRSRKKIAEYGDMQSVLWTILQDGYGIRG